MGRVTREGYLAQRAATLFDREGVPWDALCGKRVMVTGSTGLIGSQLVRALIEGNERHGMGTGIVLPVRNMAKASGLFGNRPYIRFVPWSLGYPVPGEVEADVVFHAASSTSSSDFLNRPVEVAASVCGGAKNLLDYSLSHGVQRFVFLSTMEVYGEIDAKVGEGDMGALDPMVVRNSYPEAKRLAENLVAAYASEYGLSASVVRLAQTFGEGVDPADGRVFAEFGRCAVNGKDIVLLTSGEKRNVYLSVLDAVAALVTVAAKGEPGKAYNAGNEATYCSVRDMAELVMREFGAGDAQVTFGQDAARAATFRRSSNLLLDCSRLQSLGWKPQEGLVDMYRAMLDCWEAGR